MKRKYRIVNVALNKVVKTLWLTDRQAFPLLYAQVSVNCQPSKEQSK